jgi:hypothetical protein
MNIFHFMAGIFGGCIIAMTAVLFDAVAHNYIGFPLIVSAVLCIAIALFIRTVQESAK